MRDNLIVPRVHLNGTSKQALLDQYSNAIVAIQDAGRKLALASPHGRDYYVIDGNPIGTAMDQHAGRMAKLKEVADELEQIALTIMDQE